MSVREDLKAYIDGELSAARAEEVRRAVDRDQALGKEVQFMKVLGDSIREDAVEPEVNGAEEVLRVVRAKATRRILFGWSGTRSTMRVVQALVGVLAVCVLVAVLFPMLAQTRYAARSAGDSESSSIAGSEPLSLDVMKMPNARGLSGATAAPKPPNAIGSVQQYSPGFRSAARQTEGDSAGGNDFLPGQGRPAATAGGGGLGGAAGSYPGPEPQVPNDDDRAHERFKSSNGTFGTTVSPAAAPKVAQGKSANSTLLSPPSNRKLIQNGDMEIVVGDVAQAQTRAASIASGFGGFVSDSGLTYDDHNVPRASLTLKVPARAFAATVQAVSALGTVKANDETGEDVTSQFADTDARLKELQAEADSYVTMLRAAKTIGQILEIKDRLSSVRQDINSYQEQLSSLKDQSALSTLSITFDQKPTGKTAAERDTETKDTWASDTWATAVNGLSAAGRFLGRVVICLFVFAPIWVPFIGFIWWLNKRRG